MMKTLAFSEKYTNSHAVKYFNKHRQGLRRLTTWREISLARKALRLAGEPSSVLDLPSGAGRFWEMLAENPDRKLFAADNSQAMLNTAQNLQPPHIAKRFTCFQTSAFAIDMEANAVDHILCMRLMHHIQSPEDRLQILREFYRVARQGVTLSLWVDGNLRARRRMRADNNKSAEEPRDRLVIPHETLEQEFKAAGFSRSRHLDVLPGISMWRFYILDK